MRKVSRLALAGALVASSLVTAVASASDDACDDQTVIFSRTRATVEERSVNSSFVNANALTCLAEEFGGVETGDHRRLAPGANQITVRFVTDLGPETLVVVLNGLGFSDTEVALVYTPEDPDTGLGGTSDSAYVFIPESGSGVVSADVYQIGVGGVGTNRVLLDSVHFRTADQL